MAAVYLKLVSLIVILLLQKIAGMVVILDISLSRLDHVDRWSVRQTFYFINISSDIS